MNWSVGKPTTICYPSGNFDIETVIDEIAKYEALGFDVTEMFVTHDQYTDMRRWDLNDLSWNDRDIKIFGVKVKVDNTPPWCVGIIEEQDERYFDMYRELQQFVLQQAGGFADTKNDQAG